MFDHTSRYYDIETTEYTAADGRRLAYKRRRFVPPGSALSVLQDVTVVEGDRLDRITHNSLGDPEQFWQVCDANNALNPADLTAEIGTVLHIPFPQA